MVLAPGDRAERRVSLAQIVYSSGGTGAQEAD